MARPYTFIQLVVCSEPKETSFLIHLIGVVGNNDLVFCGDCDGEQILCLYRWSKAWT